MLKYNKPVIAICLFVQSISFLLLHFLVTSKKKSWARAILLLSAAGAACGALLLWRQSLENRFHSRRRQNAMDAFCDVSDDAIDDDFDFGIPSFNELELDESDLSDLE